jgi:hypothetical protein
MILDIIGYICVGFMLLMFVLFTLAAIVIMVWEFCCLIWGICKALYFMLVTLPLRLARKLRR